MFLHEICALLKRKRKSERDVQLDVQLRMPVGQLTNMRSNLLRNYIKCTSKCHYYHQAVIILPCCKPDRLLTQGSYQISVHLLTANNKGTRDMRELSN